MQTQDQFPFRELHQTKNIVVDVSNIANPDALPAPLIVSSKQAEVYEENKLLLTLTNWSNERLIIGGPGAPSGIYVNFADMMEVASMRRISVSIAGTPVHAMVEKPEESETPTGDSPTSPLPDPSLPPAANARHISDEYILYIWPEKELYIGIGETLTLEFENVVSDSYPAIRYLSVSWQFRIDELGTVETRFEEGFRQLTMELRRPAGFVEPPLPIQAHWLDGQNTIYTSSDSEDIKNELYFALSNVGRKNFVLDCSKHSRGVPYFELIMVGVADGQEDVDFNNAVARADKLALAELKSHSADGHKRNFWKVNKRIQARKITWEIRPDLESADFDGTILGVDTHATATFRLYSLSSRLPDGVALAYFRYYNMPEHDDGQLVLFLEKKRVDAAHTLTPQLAENGIASPLSWKVERGNAGLTTAVTVGGAIPQHEEDSNQEKESTNEAILPLHFRVKGNTEMQGNLEVKGNTEMQGKLEVKENLEVQGDTRILDGTLTVASLGQLDKNLMRKETLSGTLKLIGTKKGSSMWRIAQIEATADDNDSNTGGSASKMIIKIRKNDDGKEYPERMVIDSEGRVGIGTSLPEQRLHVKDGDVRVENGNMELFHPGQGSFYPRRIKFDTERNWLSFYKRIEGKWKPMLRIKGDGDYDDGITFFNSSGRITTSNGHYVSLIEGEGRRTEIGARDKIVLKTTNIDDAEIHGIVKIENSDLILADGDVVNASDRSLKSNILPLSETYNISELLRVIEPVSFSWKNALSSNNARKSKVQCGFIANDVQNILPDAVSKIDEMGTLGLDYKTLNTVLFQAVKDQQKDIEELKAEVSELREAVAEMRAEIRK